MKLFFLTLTLLVVETSHSLCGQTLPETNNKKHYTNLAANREMIRLYRKLKAGYPFDKLAQEQSQDYGSYATGGKLGWQKLDQFVPPFGQVISQMSKDQFSKPFKTEFGYHIVQLLDQKQGEVLIRHILLRVDN